MTDIRLPLTRPRPTASDTLSRKGRGLVGALLLLAVLLPLAGCGKKSEPGPPPGEPNTFPRTYPHE